MARFDIRAWRIVHGVCLAIAVMSTLLSIVNLSQAGAPQGTPSQGDANSYSDIEMIVASTSQAAVNILVVWLYAHCEKRHVKTIARLRSQRTVLIVSLLFDIGYLVFYGGMVAMFVVDSISLYVSVGFTITSGIMAAVVDGLWLSLVVRDRNSAQAESEELAIGIDTHEGYDMHGAE